MKTAARDERTGRIQAEAKTPTRALPLAGLALGLLAVAGVLVLIGLGPAAQTLIAVLALYVLVFLGLGLFAAAILEQVFARRRCAIHLKDE